MVYLLIVIQMVLSIISFLKGRKRIIYPPFVLNAAFLILGIVGLFCKYNISWVIVAFIGICNFVVTIIYSFLDRKKWSREKADLNKLNISNIKLGILYSIQIVSALSLILFFKNVMNITTFENITEYINNFNSDYELNYAKLLPIYIGILDNISFAITVVFTYALVKNYCLYNSKKEYVLMNYKLLGCYLLYIPIIMLMNKNFNVVVLFVLSFFTWFIICCKKNKLFNKKYIEIIFSLFLTAACCTFYLYISNKNNKILECLSIGLCVYIIFLFIKKVMFIEKIENRFREKQNIKKIQNADIVSFDLYDTLVNRITLKNEAVYKAVKKWCDKENIEIDPNYMGT